MTICALCQFVLRKNEYANYFLHAQGMADDDLDETSELEQVPKFSNNESHIDSELLKKDK